MIGRVIIRLSFYFSFKSGLLETYKPNASTGSAGINQKNGSRRKKYKKSKPRPPKMVAFHRPFRKLAKSAACLSALLSMLHAHCWSATLSVLRIHREDEASAVCRFFFSPFVSDGGTGADEQSIWYYWLVVVLMMLVVFAQDEFSGIHCKNNPDEAMDNSIHFIVKGRSPNSKLTRSKTHHTGDDIQGIKKSGLLPLPKSIERPKDALPMVRILKQFFLFPT